PGTCSASEAVINGLRGVNVDVVQIGATTCGKPYGFYATDNCGTTYFAIQFQGFNAKGFGAYPDGFVPGSTDPAQAGLPGCAVAEDFSHELGDPNDARVVAAMNWSVTPGTCPPPPVAAAARQSTSLSAAASDDAIRTKPPWREIRVLR
ncbi:MAG TPA: peptidase, partial [Myxococcales bacterium]|nr:peptidase [Myxococcales bacterium]